LQVKTTASESEKLRGKMGKRKKFSLVITLTTKITLPDSLHCLPAEVLGEMLFKTGKIELLGEHHGNS